MTDPQPRSRPHKPLDAGPFGPLIGSFRLHLAEAKAAKSVRTYTEAAAWFAAAHLLTETDKASWEQVDGQDVQRRMVHLLGRYSDLLGRYSDAYANNQFRGLQQSLARRGRTAPGPDDPAPRAEGDREAGASVPQRRTIGAGENLPGPLVRPPPGRRDPRRAQGHRDAAGELAGIRYDPDDPWRSDLDLGQPEIAVRGKGGKSRIVRIGHEAARALDRYLRVRAKHSLAHRPELWLGVGNRGPMTANGIYQMVSRRGQQAGVDAWPHRFRHHFSHT